MYRHCPSKVKKWNWPCARRESIWRSGGRAWRIFNIGTRQRWMVSFIPRSFYPPARSPSLQLDMVLGGPRTRLDVLETRQISYSCWELNHYSSALGRNLVTPCLGYSGFACHTQKCCWLLCVCRRRSSGKIPHLAVTFLYLRTVPVTLVKFLLVFCHRKPRIRAHCGVWATENTGVLFIHSCTGEHKEPLITLPKSMV